MPKSRIRGRDYVDRFSTPLAALELGAARLSADQARWALLRSRRIGGLHGRALRYALLGRVAKSRGELVDIREDVYLLCPQGMTLGSRISVHPMSYIDASGGVEIGNDVSIAHAVTVMSTEHTWREPTQPIRDQEVAVAPVSIGNNVWVGAGVRIIGGARIGRDCIVGAGSVVKGTIPPNSIAVGVPARVIGHVRSE